MTTSRREVTDKELKELAKTPKTYDQEEILPRLGQRVRSLRQKKGWSIRKLAEAALISQRFISDLESGRGNVSVLNLDRIARALGTSPGRLLDGDEKKGAEAPGVIALLGVRGAGKSTVGPRLGSRLKLPFFELDGLVEAEAGLAVGEIIALHGEPYYRRLERDVLQRFLDDTPAAVLACGGGIVESAETYALLDKRATTVWLRARAEDHWERVVKQGDHRPMKGNPRAMDELRRLLRERAPLYARARITVDTSEMGLRDSVEKLVRELRATSP
jgi:XRE family aerobic/anaerobic benzoate catabolism transcriptional regulator